jgi:hypothetical protein
MHLFRFLFLCAALIGVAAAAADSSDQATTPRRSKATMVKEHAKFRERGMLDYGDDNDDHIVPERHGMKEGKFLAREREVVSPNGGKPNRGMHEAQL